MLLRAPTTARDDCRGGRIGVAKVQVRLFKDLAALRECATELDVALARNDPRTPATGWANVMQSFNLIVLDRPDEAEQAADSGLATLRAAGGEEVLGLGLRITSITREGLGQVELPSRRAVRRCVVPARLWSATGLSRPAAMQPALSPLSSSGTAGKWCGIHSARSWPSSSWLVIRTHSSLQGSTPAWRTTAAAAPANRSLTPAQAVLTDSSCSPLRQISALNPRETQELTGIPRRRRPAGPHSGRDDPATGSSGDSATPPTGNY
jgi:hypothetical protein